MHFVLVLISFILVIASCSTSPTGRSQLMIVSDDQMNAMGVQSFDQLKQNTPIDYDPAKNAYVNCIARNITDAAKDQLDISSWEIVVFRDDTANAFALPGGKIGVHTGILPVAKTPAQLAAVLGHEVGHVIARHGAERVSEQLATQGGLIVVDQILANKDTDPKNRQMVMAALGIGSQFGIALPHSRTQESEADYIGLRLMAKAGFDPRESINLWVNMKAAAGRSAPPEWLSTHPANDTRIQNLQKHMGEAEALYQASGKKPNCHL